MNKPALYRSSNNITRYQSQKVLREYAEVFNWRSDGCDSVIDAGCGSGDVTKDILMPILPANFERLVGVDLSKEMIEYARQTQIHPKLSFEHFNLEVELEKQSLNCVEPVDHIFSFFCMMWIQNMRVCVENFFKLLKTGGDVFLVYLAHHPVFDVYRNQSKDNRWYQYMTDVDRQLKDAFQHSERPDEDLKDLLSKCGFRGCDVRIEESAYSFDSIQSMRDLFHSVNPFVDRIPDNDQEAYLDDLMNQIIEKSSEDIRTGQLTVPSKIIVASARK